MYFHCDCKFILKVFYTWFTYGIWVLSRLVQVCRVNVRLGKQGLHSFILIHSFTHLLFLCSKVVMTYVMTPWVFNERSMFDDSVWRWLFVSSLIYNIIFAFSWCALLYETFFVKVTDFFPYKIGYLWAISTFSYLFRFESWMILTQAHVNNQYDIWTNRQIVLLFAKKLFSNSSVAEI